MSKSNENVLKLSILEKEYETLLLQYELMYDEYIDALKGNALNFEIAKSSKYVGLKNLNEVTAANENDCRYLCYDNDLCDGANYDSVKRKCSLFSNSGKSQISAGKVSDFAIYSNIKTLNEKLNVLNLKLVEITNKIFKIVKTSSSDYKNNRGTLAGLTKQIKTNYERLNDDKKR